MTIFLTPALAQEDLDLERIPSNIPAPAASDVATGQQAKAFWDNAIGIDGERNNPVVALPQPHHLDAQARDSLDATVHDDLAGGLSANLSDRMDLSWRDDLDTFNHRAIANNLREAYLTWEPLDETYLESGRINLRNGTALGFNPTDFFKTRSSVTQTSLDPSALRNNRLGAFMARAQKLWSDGAFSLAWAPKLAAPQALTAVAPGGFGTMSGRTNAEDRVLVSLSEDMLDLAPQALVYHEANRTRFGLDLSHPVGQSVILYGEWAGGTQSSDIAQAIAFGKQSGTLPAPAPAPPSSGAAAGLKNDASLGASWTSSEKVTLNVEYHFHQAGWSRRDLSNGFTSGARGSPQYAQELWYLRRWTCDQQAPLVRQQVFLRADWTDAMVSHLELSALAFVDVYDGSSLAQFAATYDLSDRWTMGLYATTALGSARSEYGSLPQAAGLTAEIIRYF